MGWGGVTQKSHHLRGPISDNNNNINFINKWEALFIYLLLLFCLLIYSTGWILINQQTKYCNTASRLVSAGRSGRAVRFNHVLDWTGPDPFAAWYTRTGVLKRMHAATGNQWGERRSGVAWDNFGMLKTSRAAASRMRAAEGGGGDQQDQQADQPGGSCSSPGVRWEDESIVY